MENNTEKNRFLKIIGSEWALGFLVAVLSVLIALAAYQSAIFDSKESDFNVEGQKLLTDSNGSYLEANQFVIYDYSMYDGWYINTDVNDELAQYYSDSFSENLTASMEREAGPFDDQYYTEMYADAEAQYDEAITNFESAQQAGDKADRLQLVVLVLAVGLALAAYGSMISEESKLRYVFAVLSIVSLVFGLMVYFTA